MGEWYLAFLLLFKSRAYLDIHQTKLVFKNLKTPLEKIEAGPFESFYNTYLPPGKLQRLALEEVRPPADLGWDTLGPRQLLAHTLGEEDSGLVANRVSICAFLL